MEKNVFSDRFNFSGKKATLVSQSIWWNRDLALARGRTVGVAVASLEPESVSFHPARRPCLASRQSDS